MKTILGVLDYLEQNQNIVAIASEFYGKPNEQMNEEGSDILWLTFNSKTNAKEFANIIRLRCVDRDITLF